MVHVVSLLAVFLHTLQHTDVDESIGEQQTEELAFHCLALGLWTLCPAKNLASLLAALSMSSALRSRSACSSIFFTNLSCAVWRSVGQM